MTELITILAQTTTSDAAIATVGAALVGERILWYIKNRRGNGVNGNALLLKAGEMIERHGENCPMRESIRKIEKDIREIRRYLMDK